MTVTTDVSLVAAQIEQEHPGYHVWVSDERWWYATKTSSRARGWAATVDGANPEKLAAALCAEAMD